MVAATLTHSLPAALALRTVRDGRGGRTLVVFAEPGDGATFPAGLHREPAATPFEAVLSYLADERGYDRIVAFTGTNHAEPGFHLPGGLVVGDGLRVGLVPGVWELRAPVAPSATAPAATAPARLIGVDALRAAMGATMSVGIEASRASQPGRVLERFQGEPNWFNQAEAVLKRIDEALGRQFVNERFVPLPATAGAPTARRTLLLLDEAVLLPETHQLPALYGNPFKRNQVTDRLNGLPGAVARSTADLIFLVRSGANLSALYDARMIHDHALRLQYPGPNAPTSDPNLPRMHWRADSAPTVRLPRLDSESPFVPHLPAVATHRTTADALRNIAPRKPKAARARPAADPTIPDLAFWSDIDIDGLRDRLHRDVIGQRPVIADVLTALAAFRQTCRDALANTRPRLPARKDYRPPIFLFLGESGMGKTHLARVLADHLFGAAHFELIKLTQKSAADELIGAQKSFVGYDDCPLFLRYCQRTGGLGLVTFDELDKVKRDHTGGKLDHATNSFLGPLEDWNVVPNNPAFTNTDDRAHFANTVLVFTANLLFDDSAPRAGYERLGELGAPLLGRLTYQLAFESLGSEDVLPAVRFFLAQYLRQLAEDVFCDLPVTARPELVEMLAAEFESTTTGRAAARTFRTLKESFLPARLPTDPIKDKFRRKDTTVGIADASGAWRSAFAAG